LGVYCDRWEESRENGDAFDDELPVDHSSPADRSQGIQNVTNSAEGQVDCGTGAVSSQRQLALVIHLLQIKSLPHLDLIQLHPNSTCRSAATIGSAARGKWKKGSERESDQRGYSRCFGEDDKFGPGRRHSLSL
jgi:hypothetical protein